MSLAAPYDPENIFAKILRGEIPCHKVYEDEHTLAFMDVMPQADCHTLVIPKTPAENILDLPPGALAATIVTTQRVARAVKRAFDAPGILIAQLNGSAAGQSVFHIHFHVVPRWDGDHNFMPVIGDTRVLPQALSELWTRLKPVFAAA